MTCARRHSIASPLRLVVILIAGAAALFHLYAAGVSPFTALVQRPIHLAMMGTLGFLGLGVRLHRAESSRWNLARTAVLVTALVFACTYLVVVHDELVLRAGAATPIDLIAGFLAVVVTLELARRTAGWGLVTVASLAIGYTFLGPYLPSVLAHRGYSLRRLLEHLYLSTEGLWGVPLGVSADFVYLFVLFGAVLDAAGGGQLLIGLSNKIAGSTKGGPAKTAAVASAFMGSLSGSAVANVATTGTLTIPVMKRSGFPPHVAGGIEAAASTGGQLMPPIMGAGAFILATWTSIPYLRVAVAATIPAMLYYVALFAAIHFWSRASSLAPTVEPADNKLLDRVHLLLPLAAIVLPLVLGRSPMRAAFWGVVTALAATVARRETRRGSTQLHAALVSAAAGTVQVAAACAAAGIVVGVASLTGIGLRMSEFIVALSGGHLPIALVLTALGSIVLGMGLPTTAAYIVLAALGAPALTELGVPLLAAHLFIFYFGALSNVTPPVALAAYAAAGIANAAPMRTAVTAFSLAAAGFLVPFMFVYGPPLLMQGTVPVIAGAVFTGVAGVVALAGCVVGHMRHALNWWERAALLLAAITLLSSSVVADGTGLLIVAVIVLRQMRSSPLATGSQYTP